MYNLKNLFIIILCSFMIFSACDKKTIVTPRYPALDPKNLDTTVKPGDDFNAFANGNWMKKNPVPSDKSRFGAFDELNERNNEQIKTLLESASQIKNAPKGSVEQLIGDFYASGLDTAKIEKDGLKYLKPEIELIERISSQEELLNSIVHLNLFGINPGFNLYSAQDEKNSTSVIANIYQGGLGLHDRDYYLAEDNRSKELRTEYQKHLTNMFKLIGMDENAALDAASRVFNLEKSFAQSSKTRVELRDPIANYNLMALEDVTKLAPDFSWTEYLSKMNINVKNLNICQPEFLKKFNEIYKNASLDDWKLYLKWNLIHSTASNLTNAFVNENFHFYGTVFTGTEKLKDRWKRVLDETSGSLGEAVGQGYVKKYFPPEAKKRMLDLVSNLKKSLGERIQKLEWMSDATKKEALKKLEKINVKIGYPDKWIDYSKVDISRESYVVNALNANKFLVRRELDKIGKPVDRTEWGMTPQTVNAYYSPNMNEIVFPAAILQPPFFNLDADDAVNYAAIGTVIGHEMTHGFDDQGKQYDKDGNLKDWWTAEDAQKFKEKVQILVKQFGSFVAIDTIKLDGNLTLGENIADLGGITVSYNAWKLATNQKQQTERIDGFTPQQRFFLSYAQVWRQNIRDKELMKRVKEDVHSPAKFRINGILPNVPQFYEAFPVKPGDKMYLEPKDRAVIW